MQNDAPFIRDTAAQDRPLAPPRRHPRIVWWAIAALALTGAALAWPSVQRRLSVGESVSASRLVIAPVERGPFVRDLAAEGRVVAAASPTLYAANAGAVTLKVHAGDRVARGQLLAVIDSPELSARLAQEQANVVALKAELARAEVDARQQHATLQGAFDNAQIDKAAAETDLARQQKAYEAGAVSDLQVARARDALRKATIAYEQAAAGRNLRDDSLRLDVEAKKAALAKQQLLVQDLQRQVAALQVSSPVDGQVGQLMVAEHASVAKDAQLMSVVDLSALEVQMQVAESFARDLAPGMPGEISGSGQHWRGIISTISPEVVNGEVSARLRFEGAPPTALRQNQRLAVRVLLDKRDDVLSVRRGSFLDESGGTYAYVVQDGLAVKRTIRTGARSIDKVEILSGLNPGDRVVISGTDAFHGAAQVALSH
jgi:HlyD family secretion protein